MRHASSSSSSDPTTRPRHRLGRAACDALERRTLLSGTPVATLTFPVGTGGAGVPVALSSYSFGVSVPTSGTGTGGGRVTFNDLTATATVGAVSPVLEGRLEAGRAFASALFLNVYDPTGADVFQLRLDGAFVKGEQVSAADGEPAVEQLSITYGGLALTSLTTPSTVAAAAGEQVLSFTPAGSSTADQLQLVTSGWTLTHTMTGASGTGSSKGQFGTFNATDAGLTGTSAALFGDLLSGADLPLVTVTDYGPGGVPVASYSMQAVTLAQFGAAQAVPGQPLPVDSFQLAFGTMTVDYSPAGSPSVATFNAMNQSGAPLPTTPQPPTGPLLSGGSTPGVSATTPVVLEPGAPDGGGESFGQIAVGSLSYTTVAPSGGKASEPVLTLTAPLGSDAPEWLLAVGFEETYSSAKVLQQRVVAGVGTVVTEEYGLIFAPTSFGLTSAGGQTTETITLTVAQFADTYTPLNANGTPGTPVTAAFDYGGDLTTATPTVPATTLPTRSDAILSFPATSGESALQVPLQSYSVTLDNAAGSNGGIGAGTTFTDLTAAAVAGVYTPALFSIVTGDVFYPSVTLSVYDATGTVVAKYTFDGVHGAAQGESRGRADSASTDDFSLSFASVTATATATPVSPTPGPDTEAVVFTPSGASTATTLLAVGSSWSLAAAGGVSGAGGSSSTPTLSDYAATTYAAVAPNSLFASISAGTPLPSATITDYGPAGTVVDSYFLQGAYVDSLTLGYTSTGGLATSFSLAPSTGTIVYPVPVIPGAGGTTLSTATYNQVNASSQPSGSYPAPPAGSTVPGGGTAGLAAAPPLELDLSAPSSGAVAVGRIGVDSATFVATLPVAIGSVTTVGKSSLSGLTVTDPVGADGPDLFATAVAGGRYATATLIQRNAAGTVTAQWTLGTVLVQSYGVTGGAGGAAGQTEKIVLIAESLTSTVDPPAPAAAVTNTYNFQTEAGTPPAAGVAQGVLPGTSLYLRLDTSTAGTVDVWYGTAPTGTPDDTIALAGLTTPLVFTPTTDQLTDAVTVDFADGDPLPAAGLAVDGQGVTTLTVANPLAGDTVTVNGSSVTTTDAGFGSAPIAYADLAGLVVNAGGDAVTTTQSAQPAAPLSLAGDTSHETLVVTGGSFAFPAPTAGAGVTAVPLAGLTVGSGATVSLPTAAATTDRTLLHVVGPLSVAGTLDVGGNDLLLTGPNVAAVAALFRSGNLTSSAAAANPARDTTLGIAAAAGLFSAADPFDGVAPAPTDVLVRYTYDGDANLDGTVNGLDYARVDAGFLAHLTDWSHGDFNYDGTVNASDYTLIDNAFNTQKAILLPAGVAAAAAEVGTATRPPATAPAKASAAQPFTAAYDPMAAAAADGDRKVKALALTLDRLR